MYLFIFQHPYFEGCKCLLGGACRSRSKTGSWGECGERSCGDRESHTGVRPSSWSASLSNFRPWQEHFRFWLRHSFKHYTEKLFATSSPFMLWHHLKLIKSSTCHTVTFLWSPQPGWQLSFSSESPESSGHWSRHPDLSWHRQLTPSVHHQSWSLRPAPASIFSRELHKNTGLESAITEILL